MIDYSKIYIVILLVLFQINFSIGKSNNLWKNSGSTPQERASSLLSQMNTTEKLIMLHGAYNSPYIGFVPGNERLSIPEIRMNDGPQGFRDNSNVGSTTCFPSVIFSFNSKYLLLFNLSNSIIS